MKAWLTHVLEGLSTHPEDIVIEEKTDDMGILFTVTAHKDDVGVFIGRGGDHVNAIRVLLRAHGHLKDIKASLKIAAD